jgi:hypothetical protein
MVSVSSVRQAIHLSTHRLNGTSAMAHGDQATISRYMMPAHIPLRIAPLLKKSVDDNMGHHIIKMLSNQMGMHNIGSIAFLDGYPNMLLIMMD